MLSLCGHEMRFSIALEGTHTKLAITLYQIDVHRPLCDGDVNDMVEIVTRELIAPLQEDHENLCIEETAAWLHRRLGSAVTIVPMPITKRFSELTRFTGSDIQGLSLSLWMKERGEVGHVPMYEEGSMYLLKETFLHNGLMHES